MTESAIDVSTASGRPTRRSLAKAERRRDLLRAAAHLIAERGFPGVRLEDLGAAVGISGPAVYRHFPNKDALLVEILVEISRRLLAGGTQVAETTPDPRDALEGLVDFHLDFALGEPDLIRVQDREFTSLPDEGQREVRVTQRRYVEIWVEALRRIGGNVRYTEFAEAGHNSWDAAYATPELWSWAWLQRR